MILRQLHTREQSHTESMLLSAGVSFPCLTLKYRAFTVESHSVGGNQIFRHYPTALFGVILLKLTPATSRGKYATSTRGCGLSCSSSKYRRFTVFKQMAGETPISHLYPMALFDFFHSSSKYRTFTFFNHGVAVLQLSTTSNFAIWSKSNTLVILSVREGCISLPRV